MTAIGASHAAVDRALAGSVIDAAVLMADRGLVTGTVGNLSARHGDGMLITPTRRYYDELTSADVVKIELNDHETGVGELGASREWRLHAAVYRCRPDVNAIAHTHSPYALARSFQPEPLAFWTEEAVYFDLYTVPVVPYAPGGSATLAQSAAETLGSGRGVLLERHGLLAVGDCARDAVELAAVIEHQAQVQWLVLGGSLPPGQFNSDVR